MCRRKRSEVLESWKPTETIIGTTNIHATTCAMPASDTGHVVNCEIPQHQAHHPQLQMQPQQQLQYQQQFQQQSQHQQQFQQQSQQQQPYQLPQQPYQLPQRNSLTDGPNIFSHLSNDNCMINNNSLSRSNAFNYCNQINRAHKLTAGTLVCHLIDTKCDVQDTTKVPKQLRKKCNFAR